MEKKLNVNNLHFFLILMHSYKKYFINLTTSNTKTLTIMKSIIYLLILGFFPAIFNAQVGINTTTPTATLDVNGNLKVKTVDTVSSLASSQYVLLGDTSDFEVRKITVANLLDGYSPNTAGNVYYASKDGGWSLLTLSLGGGWQTVGLTGATDTKLGNTTDFTNGVYKAPSAGTYMVSYEFQFGGVDLGVLGDKSMGLVKTTTTGTATLWDSKTFDSVQVSLLGVGLVQVPVTSSTLNSLVQLNTGETLTFAVYTSGLLSAGLTLLKTGKVNVRIYKISN